MIRTILSEPQWERIAPELPGKAGDPGATAADNRLFVEAVLWIARTGAPWRDLPNEFGKWFTVYTRFWRWAQKGIWEHIFKSLSDDLDFEYVARYWPVLLIAAGIYLLFGRLTGRDTGDAEVRHER